MSASRWLLLETIFVLGIPLYFMSSQTQVLAFRPWLMIFGVCYIATMLLHAHAKPQDIGLTLTGFVPSLRALIIPSVMITSLVALTLAVVSHNIRVWVIGLDPLSAPSLTIRILFYVFGSVPIQELIFRGYFTYRVEQVTSNVFLIKTLSVIIFVVAHAPFRSPLMTLVALSMGIYYIANYLKYRNLPAVGVAHAATGAALILLRHHYLPYT